MSTLRFSAHCERGHDPVDFTDPAAFEAHMGTEHGRKMSTSRGAAAVKPWPWRAPKAPTNTDELARVIQAAGPDVVDVSGVDGVTADGLWRWDRPSAGDVPTKILPTAVRSILEGAMARGEMWLVQVTGPTATVEVARVHPSGEPGTTRAARIRLDAGKVRKVYTVDPDRQNAPTGWWESKITEARRAFPAPGVALERAA